MAYTTHRTESGGIEADITAIPAVAHLLRAEYLTALRNGDPDTLVSTPGFAVESMTLADLLVWVADQQAALLVAQGAA